MAWSSALRSAPRDRVGTGIEITTGGIKLVRDFVHGRCEWQVLRTLGVAVDLDDGKIQLKEPPHTPVYNATASDIAVGLLANWTTGTALRDWARVLLTTGMVDLSSLEDDPRGEILLNALWDAASGAGLSEDMVEIARSLAAP